MGSFALSWKKGEIFSYELEEELCLVGEGWGREDFNIGSFVLVQGVVSSVDCFIVVVVRWLQPYI